MVDLQRRFLMYELVMLIGFLYFGLAHLLPAQDDDTQESAAEEPPRQLAGRPQEPRAVRPDEAHRSTGRRDRIRPRSAALPNGGSMC
jgi:hypothetical protein